MYHSDETTSRDKAQQDSPMHLAKFSLCSRPSLLISSNRFSTDFQPSLPADVLSRKRSPRKPDCAPECVRLRPRISGTADDTFDASRRIPDAIRDGCFLIGGGTGGGVSPSPRPPVPPSAYPTDDAISGERNRSSSPTQPMVVRARSLTAAWPWAPFHTQRLVGCKFGNGKGREGKGREMWRMQREMRAPIIAVHAPAAFELNTFVPQRIAMHIFAHARGGVSFTVLRPLSRGIFWSLGKRMSLHFNSSEKNNNMYNNRWFFLFNIVVDTFDLREVDLIGRQFIWANSLSIPTYEKLVWIWMTTEWELKHSVVVRYRDTIFYRKWKIVQIKIVLVYLGWFLWPYLRNLE